MYNIKKYILFIIIVNNFFYNKLSSFLKNYGMLSFELL